MIRHQQSREAQLRKEYSDLPKDEREGPKGQAIVSEIKKISGDKTKRNGYII